MHEMKTARKTFTHIKRKDKRKQITKENAKSDSKWSQKNDRPNK